MKKIIQVLYRLIRIFYKILPFFVGMYCYYPVFVQDHRFPFLDAVYSSIKLYSGSTESGVPIDGLLELARFLALAATLSILISALDKVNDVINWSKLLSPGTTVVYGDSSCADCFLASLNPMC